MTAQWLSVLLSPSIQFKFVYLSSKYYNTLIQAEIG